MKILLSNFHILFSVVILTLFAFVNILQTDQISVHLIVSLLLFGLLIFSLVSMADPTIVNLLQHQFGNNLISALTPLTGLFIISIAVSYTHLTLPTICSV